MNMHTSDANWVLTSPDVTRTFGRLCAKLPKARKVRMSDDTAVSAGISASHGGAGRRLSVFPTAVPDILGKGFQSGRPSGTPGAIPPHAGQDITGRDDCPSPGNVTHVYHCALHQHPQRCASSSQSEQAVGSDSDTVGRHFTEIWEVLTVAPTGTNVSDNQPTNSKWMSTYNWAWRGKRMLLAAVIGSVVSTVILVAFNASSGLNWSAW